ncbi:MAG: hypothetical protein AMXMBFR56_48840 [Polyangiaceae bacterium]
MTNQDRLSTLLLALCLAGCGSEDSGGAAAASGGNGGHGSVSAAGGAPASGGASGAAGSAGADPCPRFVTSAVDHAFGSGQNIGQAAFPGPILGPPRGGGDEQGSLDVVSLGNGGHVTVAFGQTRIVDGPGPDFIVFENAFFAGGDPNAPFAELGTVEVSTDGKSWTAFPCTESAAPYGSCAGWHPVYANADENAVDPLDPAVAGGDAFDLADVGVAEARFVRVTDRADLEGMNGVFDLDAVGIVNAACP